MAEAEYDTQEEGFENSGQEFTDSTQERTYAEQGQMMMQQMNRPLSQRELARQGEIEALQEECSRLDESFPFAHKLLQLEMYRIRGGVSDVIDAVGPNKRARVRARLAIPIDQFPGFNVVGKLLGKGGSTLKKMQEETETKLAILGSGSMRDENKEQEVLGSGDPKYQHLRLPMHLQIDCLAAPEEAFYRVSHAVAEAKKLMTPSPEEMMAFNQPQGFGGGQSFGPPRGRGGGGRGRGRGGGGFSDGQDSFRGGSRGRGGSSSFGGGRGGGGPPRDFSNGSGGGFGGGYGQDFGGGKAPRGGPRGGGGRGSHPYGGRGRGQ